MSPRMAFGPNSSFSATRNNASDSLKGGKHLMVGAGKSTNVNGSPKPQGYEQPSLPIG